MIFNFLVHYNPITLPNFLFLFLHAEGLGSVTVVNLESAKALTAPNLVQAWQEDSFPSSSLGEISKSGYSNYSNLKGTCRNFVINPRCCCCSHSVCVCEWVSVCVCLLPRYLLHTLFLCLKCGVIRFLTAFSLYVLCGFSWQRSVPEFWRALQVTAAFLAPWWALDEENR